MWTFATQNGYVLYFSDRRGMQFATAAQGANYQSQWGEYGYEDTVNYANAGANFAPDGKLDAVNYNGVSAEDVNGNLLLDVYGVKYVGDAFGTATTTDTDVTAPPSPFALVTAFHTFTAWPCQPCYGRTPRIEAGRRLAGQPAHHAAGQRHQQLHPDCREPHGLRWFHRRLREPGLHHGQLQLELPCSRSELHPEQRHLRSTWTSAAAAEPLHAAASSDCRCGHPPVEQLAGCGLHAQRRRLHGRSEYQPRAAC